jgi:toxin ParE1/3/4
MAIFRLAASAQADIAHLLAWTEVNFGDTARRRYETLLITGLRDIASDPERAGSAARPELGEAVRSYHLRHSRERARLIGGLVRRPRHLLLYRELVPGVIGVGRVLYDAMEIEAHLPPDYGDG